MTVTRDQRGDWMRLAAEAIAPALNGCAAALAARGRAIDLFGGRLAEALNRLPAGERPPGLDWDEARRLAEAALLAVAPDAVPEDRAAAADYLAAVAAALGRELPETLAGEADELLSVLPADAPPYRVPSELPGTPYRLEALLGTGGFGAVYRASAQSLQHLPLAIKFCLDPAMTVALRRERDNLQRLMEAGGERASNQIVRLYGYDLDHATPYLVYEYVAGGDLARHLRGRGPMAAAEAVALITSIAEALAFAHAHGLVHRDLKPANVLLTSDTSYRSYTSYELKLADFGLGAVTAARVAKLSRMQGTTVAYLSLATRGSVFRGAGTPLYMAPEQRRGADPDPRHDLYSLGVMWYQLLVGDVTRELHPGWARELAALHSVPTTHIETIGRCVGWAEERPADAQALVRLIRGLNGVRALPPTLPAPPPLPAAESETARRLRSGLVQAQLDKLRSGHERESVAWDGTSLGWSSATALAALGLAIVLALTALLDYAWPILLLGATAACVLQWVIASFRWMSARADVLASVAALEADFPEVARSWGGRPALSDGATFLALSRLAPGERGSAARRTLLTSLVRRLDDAHADLARLPGRARRWLLPVMPLALILFVVGIGQQHNSDQALYVGTAAALLASGLFQLAGHFVLAARRTACVRQLAAEYPEEVRSWGGAVVLREPAAVTEVRAVVERDDPGGFVPPAWRPNFAPAERGPALTDRLEALAKRHRAVRGFLHPDPVPPAAVALLAAMLVGLPVGLVVADACFRLWHPVAKGMAVYTYRGVQISPIYSYDELVQLGRRDATRAGLMAGFAAAALAAWPLATLRRYRGQVVGSFCAAALMFGFPAGMGTMALMSLRVPEGGEWYQIELSRHRQAAQLELASLAVCLAATAAGTALLHGRFRARLDTARRRAEEEVAAFAADFPGTARLWARDPTALERALRALELI